MRNRRAASSIRNQTAGGREFADRIDGRNRIARRKFYQLIALAIKERVSRYNERARLPLNKVVE